MNRRKRIMELYDELRSLLRDERESVQTSGEPDNLNEAQWALSDSELWYRGLQGAVDSQCVTEAIDAEIKLRSEQ